jgi:hypothetical protein
VLRCRGLPRPKAARLVVVTHLQIFPIQLLLEWGPKGDKRGKTIYCPTRSGMHKCLHGKDHTSPEGGC